MKKLIVLVIVVLVVCTFAQNNLTDFRPTGGGATLSINVNGGVAAIGTTPTVIVGKNVALVANATNYVFVDLVGGTISSNTTGFASTTYPIAVAITNATQVTSLTDSRPGAYATSGGGGSTNQITQSSLVGYYRMLEGSGTTLTDSSGNGNTGTFAGGGNSPTWINASTGGLSFVQASNQYVSLPTALNAARSFCFAYNFQIGSNFSGTTMAPFVSEGTPLGGTVITIGFYSVAGGILHLDLNNKIRTVISGGPAILTEANNSGQGSHVVCFTGTGANDDVIYFDGIPSPLYTIQQMSNTYTGNGGWRLGGGGVYLSGSFGGQMYSAAFWTRKITALEVAQSSQAILTDMQQRGIKMPVTTGTGQGNEYVMDGDSVASGLQEGSNSLTPWYQLLVLPISGTLWQNGQPATQVVTQLYPNSGTQDFYFNTGAAINSFIEEGAVNDYNTGLASVAAVTGALSNLVRQRRAIGYRTFVTTLMTNPASNAIRGTHNAYMRQHWPEFADGLIDFASDPNLGCDACAGVTPYFGDTLHPSLYGDSFMQAMTQRALARGFGAKDFTSATIYVAAAVAATTVTATSDTAQIGTTGLSTATYTFASHPFLVGQTVTCTGITPAGYNTTLIVKTINGTQITGIIGTAALGVGTVFGSCSTPQQADQDAWSVLNFGAGNFNLATCVGYTGQRLYIKNINAVGSTIVPLGTETIDGAANLAIAAQQERILESRLVTPTTPVCSWRVIQ